MQAPQLGSMRRARAVGRCAAFSTSEGLVTLWDSGSIRNTPRVVLRGRDPRTAPGHVAAVAVGVLAFGVLVAVLALPGVAVSGSAAGQLAAQELRFTFDARQVILVGGITTMLASFLGFQVGARLWQPIVRMIPALAGGGPEPVHFR